MTIAANATTATYSVTTQDDSTDENNGEVRVVLSSGAGYTVGTDDRTSVTVYDNDGAGSVSLALNSAGADNTYRRGDAIEITATFSENVTVSGTPRIPFTIGTTERHADYSSGTGGTALVFSYTVQTADADTDGITVAVNALELNGGAINTSGGAAAALDHAAVAASTSHKVDGGAASVSGVAFTTPPSGNYAAIGSDIEITATFDRPVTVAGGPPRIPLSPAFGPNDETRRAVYAEGSGTTKLVFRYTLVEGDDSGTTQVSAAANALELNGGTIRTGTANAAITHTTASSGKTVSAKRPRITSIVTDPGPGVDRDLNGDVETFVGGSGINVAVVFDQDIAVDLMGQNSNVQVVLTIGTTDYPLVYRSAHGSDGILFAGYTVKSTDRDDDGITLERQSVTNHVIRLSGSATIKGAAAVGGNDAVLTAADPKVTWKPAGEDPVTSLNVRGTNTAPTSSASRVGTATDTDYTFRVADFTFSDTESDPLKEVQIVSLPTGAQGALKLSGAAVTAGQTVSRSDIANLVFDPAMTFEGNASFTFKAVDSFGAASATAATMTIAVGASVSLSFNSAGADNAYHTNDAIEITATFGESVTVSTTGGRPRIPFTIGTTERHAVYSSGSGSTDLVFTYTVVAADLDTDGIEVAEDALELNGGTIVLTATPATAAALDHAAAPANAARKVNVAKPAAPAAPGVSTTDGTTLIVTWTAPANTRPDITDYDVEYRRKNVPGGDPTDWTDASHTGTALADTITGLVQGASYEARVRATNGEGSSDWSTAASGHTGPARVVSAETNTAGTRIAVTFTKRVSQPGRAGQYQVRVNADEASFPQLSTVALGQLLLVLFDSQTIQHGDTRTLEYSAPTSGSRLADADGLFVASFSGQSVTNTVPAPTPVVTKATLVGKRLDITFSQPLGTLPQGLPSTLTVKLGTTAQALQSVSIQGSVLTIVLVAAPGAGAVTVSYAQPATSRLKGADGTDVESFTDQAVARPATVSSATTDATGRFVRITFNKDITASGSSTAYRVVVGGTEREPVSATWEDAVVSLALATDHVITAGQTVTVKYTKPTGSTAKLSDSDGLEVESFTGQSVTNIVPTVFQSATTNAAGDRVTITFTGPVKNTALDFGGFSVTADGTSQTPNGAGIQPQGTLELHLGTAITAGQTVTVSYSKPATNKLVDTSDREVAAFTDQPVTNAVPATVTGVAITSNPGADGTYQRDDTIEVTVTFSAPVTVNTTGGTPHLILHFQGGNGALPAQRNKQASYESGSGTNMLVFAYTVVQADDSTAGTAAAKGVAVRPNGIRLNNGTIRTGTTDATLTHSAVQHAANHQVNGSTAQDTTGPAVSTTTLPTVNGASLVITFNEALDATRTAPAASAFTVKVGGTSVDLADTNPVAVSGSAVTLTLAAAVIDADRVTVAYDKPSANPIQDFTAGNEAPSFGDTDVRNNTPGVAPTVLTDPAPVVGGTRLVITFSEPLREDAAGLPATSAFTVMVAGNNRGVSSVAVSGATAILTLESAAVFGETVTVSYTQPTGATDPKLQDRALFPNPVATFSNVAVTNNDNTAPSFSSAAVDGAALTITFDENLDATSEPPVDRFLVRVENASRAVSNVDISGATATLTLTSAVTPGQGVTVLYSEPTIGPGLQDGATNKVANFGPETVQNDTRAAVTGAPAVTSSPALGDTYGLGEHIELTVTFSHAVTVTGTPQLALQVGSNARQASYQRSNGATALVFRYTVVAADADADGIFVGPNGLTLNGGAIQDAGSGAATLAHGTLGIQAGHKVDGTLVRTAVTIAGGGPVAEGGNATFTLTAAPAPAADITVNLEVAQGGDYVAAANLGSQTVTVPASGTATYTVPTVNDAADEPNGSVTVTVQAGTGYTVGSPAAASVTVNDNDAPRTPPPPTPSRPAFSRAAVSGTALTITFNRSLDTGSAPAGSAFTVTATPTGGSARSISGTGTTSIAGATVTVTLESAVASGETVRVAYTRPSANPLRGSGSGGREVTNFTGRSVANHTPTGPSSPPPEGGRVSGGGATVTLTFADELDAASTPDPGDFTVTVAAASDAPAGASPAADDHYRVTAVSILGATLELTISPPVPEDREAAVSYTPGARPLRTAAGAAVPNFSVTVPAATPPPPPPPPPPANRAPAFDPSRYAFELREHVDGSAQPVALGAVTAADPDGDALAYTLASGDSARFAVGSGDGAVSYVGPGEDFETEPNVYELAVRASDPGGLSAEASVTVTIVNVVELPVAANDTVATDEDVALTVDVLANDADPEGGGLRVASVSAAEQGSAEVTADGGGVLYTPPANWHGTDRFTYVAEDGNGATSEASVEVTVRPVNDAPEAAADTASTDEDVAVTVDVLANDTDIDGDSLRVASVSAPANGTATITADGRGVLYTPAENWHGTDSFTYVADDGNGGTASAAVEVTVRPVNDLPVAVDDKASTNEDEAVTVDVLANDTDPDGDGLRLASVSAPENGTARIAAGVVLYMPAANFSGTDRFTYEVEDGQGGRASAAVEVTVA